MTEIIIYKIYCKDKDIKEAYVGSTKNFKQRKIIHKTACNEGNKSVNNSCNVYKFIRKNGGWDNWDMVKLESKVCKDIIERRAIERKYIEELEAPLNKRIPGRSKEEIKEYKKEYMKTYKWDTPHSKTYYRQKYYCEECEKELSKRNKHRHNKSARHIYNSNNVIKKTAERYKNKKA